MSLAIHLQDLEQQDLHLEGELAADALDFGIDDKTIQDASSLKYSLTAQLLPDAVLVRGQLALTLGCECVRCLAPLQYPIEFPDWICHLPLCGEEKVPVNKGCVDLTPYIREDTLLAFPQHPLCRKDCPGLSPKGSNQSEDSPPDDETSSPWDSLNQLKL